MKGIVVAAATALVAFAVACGSDDPPQRPPAVPLTASGCSPMSYGGDGRPDVLIAAILAVQGPFFDHGVQDSQSLKMVLDEHGWRAGDRRVGLQICDEATARSPEGYDAATCRRHAREFARNKAILAVVGPVLSGCAREMLPILNRAPGGPLALVSPSTTYLGLTRSGPGVAEGDPERNFPTGRRSFVRLATADDAQAAAAVLFAKRRGAARAFVLDDDGAYGAGLAGSFRTAAEREGIEVAGSATWDAKADGYRELAQRIKRTGADAVYLGGYITSNGPRLVRDLRAALGPDVQIIAPDGFNQPANLVEGAGPGAEHLVLTIGVVPNDDLPRAGREFASEFEERFSQRPCCFAVHAGQTGEIVIDAIDASDGSRDDVLAKLFATRVDDGLLGDFRIDRYGDTTLTQIGIYRIEGGKLGFEAAISPPSSLLERK